MRAALAPLRMVSRLAVLERPGGIAAVPVDRAVGEMGVEVDQAGQHGFARPVDRRRAVGVAPRRDRRDPAVDDADALVGQHLGASRDRSGARRGRRRFAADAALASKQRQRAGQDVPHHVPPFVARKPRHRDEVPQSTIAKVAKVGTSMRARAREGHRGCVYFVDFVPFRAKRSERSDPCARARAYGRTRSAR